MEGILFVTCSMALCLACLFHSARPQSMDPRVNITETDPPSIGARVRGTIAKDVLLNCYVENLPNDLTVRWQRTMYDRDGRSTINEISSDTSVEDNMKYSIEKPAPYSWRLRVKALAVQDEGNYTCYVMMTRNNNRAESNRTVLATAPPDILEDKSSSDMTADEGDDIELRCNASGRPWPTIVWRRQGNAILPGGGVRYMGAKMNIDSIKHTARGLYICETLNEVGYARRDITVTVRYSPKLIPDPPRLGQAVGYRRTLVCQVDANPRPTDSPGIAVPLAWLKQGRPVLPDDRISFKTIVGAHSRLTFEMSIRRVQKDDYGDFTCRGQNSVGYSDAKVHLYETNEPQPDKRGEISGTVAIANPATALLLLTLTTMFTENLL